MGDGAGVGSNVAFSSETQPFSSKERKTPVRDQEKEAEKKEGSKVGGEVWREGDIPNDSPPHL